MAEVDRRIPLEGRNEMSNLGLHQASECEALLFRLGDGHEGYEVLVPGEEVPFLE